MATLTVLSALAVFAVLAVFTRGRLDCDFQYIRPKTELLIQNEPIDISSMDDLSDADCWFTPTSDRRITRSVAIAIPSFPCCHACHQCKRNSSTRDFPEHRSTRIIDSLLCGDQLG